MVVFNENQIEEEMTAEEFGAFLVFMREKIGINQYDMAELLGYNKNTYNAYENGKRIPRAWVEVEKKIRELVKEDIVQKREAGLSSFKDINQEISDGILKMHYKGKNVVQIGIFYSLDEAVVFEFLLSKDLMPIDF